MPAISVRSEEVFSTAGNVITHERNKLLPEKVNRLVFLHENLMDQVFNLLHVKMIKPKAFFIVNVQLYNMENQFTKSNCTKT